MESFSFVIAEKPDAARRIASALGRSVPRKYGSAAYYEVHSAFDGKRYRICAAAGHLYGIGDPNGLRKVYPVFDVEWFPIDQLSTGRKWRALGAKTRGAAFSNYSSQRIAAIAELSQGATEIIHACDYDTEGETIGYNIIRYACRRGPETLPHFRARFSTLTEADIRGSFAKLEPADLNLSEAGRTRHVIDFLWGVNLSRAISEAYRESSHVFMNLTVGRVQGPTLSFVVHRDAELKSFVPIPYWTIAAVLSKDGMNFQAVYEKERIEVESEAEKTFVQASLEKKAKLESLKKDDFNIAPPCPFNIGDLQRESFRRFGFSPSVTLAVAERLYLGALISYPRTNSQKLPPSIGYGKIISSLLRQPTYGQFSQQMSEETRRNFPVQGHMDDPAHSAIYPTGVTPAKLSALSAEGKIYDLVVRRFLSGFAEDSVRSETAAEFLLGKFPFRAKAVGTLKEGWKSIYHSYDSLNSALPELVRGEYLEVVSVDLGRKFTEPPRSYTQASLLQRMDGENIGTKATRADTIATLIDRGYLTETSNRTLTASDLGIALVDVLESCCNDIVSASLTRNTEERIEGIQTGKERAAVAVNDSLSHILSILKQIHSSRSSIGAGLIGFETATDSRSGGKGSRLAGRRYVRRQIAKPLTMGSCPSCDGGSLMVITSWKTKKRFLGCSNYSTGCRSSAPLPQRGFVLRMCKVCSDCRWPIVGIRFARGRKKAPWEICPNPRCVSKNREKVSKHI